MQVRNRQASETLVEALGKFAYYKRQEGFLDGPFSKAQENSLMILVETYPDLAARMLDTTLVSCKVDESEGSVMRLAVNPNQVRDNPKP